MIYQGTSANITGTGTQIGTSAFNTSYVDNMYVGYMYESNQVHGLTSSSTIKGVLDEWYQNNLTGVSDKIDGNAGFCGDRQPSTSLTTSNGNGGTGTAMTYYGGQLRLVESNAGPTFDCKSSSDLYTTSGSGAGNGKLAYPIGLITADETVYGGLLWGESNDSNYLYTRQGYWTISPAHFLTNISYARVFYVMPDGGLYNNGNDVDFKYGVRPVINLKADVSLTGTGTASDPYVVVGA